MLPPAPPRFSMTMPCPSRSESGCAMMRAEVSTPPPGGQGTISLIGWFGYPCCAWTGAARHSSIATTKRFPMHPPGDDSIGAWRPALLERDEPVPDRKSHQPRDILDAELGHDAAAIRFHGLRRQGERRRDLSARAALHHQDQDLPLALAHAIESGPVTGEIREQVGAAEILQRAYHVGRLAVLDPCRDGASLDDADGAVGPDDPERHFVRRPAAQQFPRGLFGPGAVVGVHKLHEGADRRLGLRVDAEDAPQFRRPGHLILRQVPFPGTDAGE